MQYLVFKLDNKISTDNFAYIVYNKTHYVFTKAGLIYSKLISPLLLLGKCQQEWKKEKFSCVFNSLWWFRIKCYTCADIVFNWPFGAECRRGETAPTHLLLICGEWQIYQLFSQLKRQWPRLNWDPIRSVGFRETDIFVFLCETIRTMLKIIYILHPNSKMLKLFIAILITY